MTKRKSRKSDVAPVADPSIGSELPPRADSSHPATAGSTLCQACGESPAVTTRAISGGGGLDHLCKSCADWNDAALACPHSGETEIIGNGIHCVECGALIRTIPATESPVAWRNEALAASFGIIKPRVRS